MDNKIYFGPEVFKLFRSTVLEEKELRDLSDSKANAAVKKAIKEHEKYWSSRKAIRIEHSFLNDTTVMFEIFFDRELVFTKKAMYDIRELELLGMTDFSIEGSIHNKREFFICYVFSLEKRREGNI